MKNEILKIYNCESADLGAVPKYSIEDFRTILIDEVAGGARIASFFGMRGEGENTTLIAVLAYESDGLLGIISSSVQGQYESITPDCIQAHLFEREIAEQFGIKPKGHPWPKPVRYHHSYTNHDAWGRKKNEAILPAVTDQFRVEGREIHEVAVGPVHAGIIEPGHFRFQCNGENVLHLEISLGFQHRGIERNLVGGNDGRTIHFMETAAGDTTIGHTTAYCNVMEALSHCFVPARGQVLRGIALELERLANHTGDLGALAGDTGYLPTSSFCGRIRGDFLNITALLCGNRFGRGIVRPGGSAVNIESRHVDELRRRLEAAMKDVSNAVGCLWTTPSVLNRFEDTGAISQELCEELGIVGPPARACGIERDCRYTFASGIYQFSQMSVSTWRTGDVFARAYVRWLEIQRSAAFIQEQLDAMPAGDVCAQTGKTGAGKIAVALVEGWRGEICHTAITDEVGQIKRYKIVDPSFHNWTALAMALRGQQISDFPLCNKSFNLSYCGHDL